MTLLLLFFLCRVSHASTHPHFLAISSSPIHLSLSIHPTHLLYAKYVWTWMNECDLKAPIEWMTWERVTNCGSRTGGNAKGRLELRVLQWKFCVVRPGMRYASRLRFSNSDSCGWVVYANICLYWPAAGNAQHDGWESHAIRVFARQFVELRRNGMKSNRQIKWDCF